VLWRTCERYCQTVLCQECAPLATLLRNDVVAEPEQEERGARVHEAGARYAATLGYGIALRVKGCVHHVGGQSLHDGVRAAQVDFAIAHFMSLELRLEVGPVAHCVPHRVPERNRNL